MLFRSKATVIALMLIKLFPDKTTSPASDEPLKPMSPEEKRLALVLVCALMLWATDTWHGLRPAWVALGAATILLLPRVGAVPAAMFPDRVKLGSFFYVGAVLGFGAVLQHSGVGRALGSTLLPLLHVQAGQDALNFFKLALFGTVAGLFTTNPALPALLAPTSTYSPGHNPPPSAASASAHGCACLSTTNRNGTGLRLPVALSCSTSTALGTISFISFTFG